MGINVFCFDFAGCGQSEGEFITLGVRESEDLKIVVQFLKEELKVNEIGL